MIKWEKYFDKIICINYSEFRNRKQLMDFELKRVGILDSPVFEWEITFNGPFEKMFYKMVHDKNNTLTQSRISCILGHLNAIKRAYYTGCKNVLIIEDDERFLRDLDKLQQILDKIPEGQYDVLLLDKLVWGYAYYQHILDKKENYLNDQFVKYDKAAWSAGCFALSRRGMEIIISLNDVNDINISDFYFNYEKVSHLWTRVFSITPVAVQAIFSKAQSSLASTEDDKQKSKKALEFQMGYKYQEVKFKDYMMRKDGSPYYYGDYLED